MTNKIPTMCPYTHIDKWTIGNCEEHFEGECYFLNFDKNYELYCMFNE